MDSRAHSMFHTSALISKWYTAIILVLYHPFWPNTLVYKTMTKISSHVLIQLCLVALLVMVGVVS